MSDDEIKQLMDSECPPPYYYPPLDDYGDQLQAQEPLDITDEFVAFYGLQQPLKQWSETELMWVETGSSDPTELGSISTTDGLEQQAELDPELNPELPFE